MQFEWDEGKPLFTNRGSVMAVVLVDASLTQQHFRTFAACLRCTDTRQYRVLNGLYSGASALNTLAKQQELISSNLMHVNSSGHRRLTGSVHQRFELENLDASIDLGPEIRSIQTDFEPGRLNQTDRPLDVAIAGDGFFVFDNNGSDYLTRNGRLYRDPNSNELVNDKGFPIQGEGGPITIDEGISDRNIAIAPDGTVSTNGEVLGQIKTVAFTNNQSLEAVDVTGFKPGATSVESDESVMVSQFQHELSNVQPVTELVALIVNNRQHEAVQKATRAISDALREYIRE